MPLCPSCHSEIGIWSDDPLKTPEGILNGEAYKGFVQPNATHISEIQIARNAKEQELGIEVTSFTPVNPITNHITKKHINELRLSTEKILIAVSNISASRADMLYKYFNYDADGNYIGTTKNEWVDVDSANLPNLKRGYDFFIKGIHIEELRHPIPGAEDLEYPGTGFLRRYVTLDLTNVHTTFNNLPVGNVIVEDLDSGDEIDFTSTFNVRNTENYATSFSAFFPNNPLVDPANWNLSGSISSINAQITGFETNWVKVTASVLTDGQYVYHWFKDTDYPYGNYQEIWQLAGTDTLEVCDEDAEGTPVNCRIINPVDSEIASQSWISGFIGHVAKYPSYEGTEFVGWQTAFKMYPGGWNVLESFIDEELPSPAPVGYLCKRIGNGTPSEYWQAWNENKGYDVGHPSYRTEDYIGIERVTVNLGGDYFRRYSYNWYSEFSPSSAPISALFETEDGSKSLTYTCNIS